MIAGRITAGVLGAALVLWTVGGALRTVVLPRATSSLVVRAETGGVGDGYVNHQNPQGFATFTERQQAAAVDRLTCYRVYCDHVPEDAEPQMTALYVAKNTPKVNPVPPPPKICPNCFTVLPAKGLCDYCA